MTGAPTGAPDDLDDVVTRLAGDPAFASFVGPSAGILIWDAAAETLLWASSSAQALRSAIADPSGRIYRPLGAHERLRTLAGGLAPLHGMRLEKLRLDPALLAPPVTCACRLALLESGATVLVTAIVGPLPKPFVRRPEAYAPPVPMEEPALPPSRPVEPAEPEAGWTPRGTVRFVWQADANTRFTQVSPALAEVVGPMAADIVDQTWEELAQSTVRDPAERHGSMPSAVAALFARRETFSGRVVYWRIDNAGLEVPVDWAGMPVYGPGRELIGFRGFGLIRTDAAQPVRDPDRSGGSHDAPDESLSGSGEDHSGPVEASPPLDHLAALVRGEIARDENPAAPEPISLDAGEHRGGTDETTEGGADVLDSPPIDLSVDLTGSDADEPPPADSEPAGGSADDREDRQEGWFAGLRERVAATLSGTKGRPDLDGPPVAQPRSSRPVEPSQGLSSLERSAFREIARALGARFEDDPAPQAEPRLSEVAESPPVEDEPPAHRPADNNEALVLDRLPVGVLVHRGEQLLFANRLLLDLVEYDDVDQLVAAGGVERLFRGSPTLLRSNEGGSPLALSTRHSESIAVEVRLTTVEWDGRPSSLMLIRKIPEADAAQRLRVAEGDLRSVEARVHELESILDTATDGVVVIDETGRILSLNRSAEALFGYDQREVVGDAVTVLLAPESHIVALDYLDGLRSPGVASLLNDGREVMGRVRQGGVIPLFMTMGHVNDGPDRKFCTVLRDMTAFKKAEGELIAAKRAAEQASAQKSDLLAKISHEIRTPLNAIIGFAEVMLEERFGAIGNDRYKDYLKDVHASGAHVISLVNDLLDLAKIEAGRMDLSFTSVSLNELVASCFTLLQPQASRERIVMRTSFASKLPPVVADERSVRQIVLNLVSNAIKFTDAGGQVIVSTAMTDRGEVAFRVRDTGIGMTEKEVEAALEPFRQLATARKRGGTGLGLPLTKALVEANRGALQISSSPNEGTLVEVLFPPTRVLAE